MADTGIIAYDENSRKKLKYEEQIVQESMKEFTEMQTRRANFGIQWEEVAETTLPTSRNTFFFGNYNYPGLKKTQQQVDATAMMANSRFGAILDSLLTPRNQTWHGLQATDDYVMKDRATRIWFDDVTRLLFKYRYAPSANFTSQNQQVYQSLGAFGNGALFIDRYSGPDGGQGLRYRAIPLGEIFFHENHQGQVDGFVRWYRLDARQAVQQFGFENLPEGIQAAYTSQSYALWDFIHRVCLRTDYDKDRIDEKGKRFASYHISLNGRKLVREGGFTSLPIAISRYDQTPGEEYGRGPAMLVLPAIKTLNSEKRDYLTQGHRAAVPVLLSYDDGMVDFTMRPGAMNKGGVNKDGKPLIQVLQSGEIQVTKEMMDEERALINDAFLVTLFQILTETPQMTATEVMERINEKGILLAPTVGRQQSEYLGPCIHRELDLLAQMRLLPPMPPRLAEAGGSYQVHYTSPLSLMQRAQEAAGFFRVLENIKMVVDATQDPSYLDTLDFDEAIPDIARISGVTEKWISSPQKIAQKRQDRAQKEQAMQDAQAAPGQAALMSAQAKQTAAGVPQQQQPQAQQQRVQQ